MADQLDVLVAFCSDALRAEDQAMDRLSGRAEKYLAAIGVILGFHIVENKPLMFSGSALRVACSVSVVAGLVLLFAAFVLALQSMRVRDYPTYPKTENLFAEGGKTDDQVKRDIAATYLAVRDGALAVNEKRASTVRFAGILLTLGFSITALAQLGLTFQQTR